MYSQEVLDLFDDNNSNLNDEDYIAIPKRNDLLEKQKAMINQLNTFKKVKTVELPMILNPCNIVFNSNDVSFLTKKYTQLSNINCNQFTLTKFLYNFINKSMNIRSIRLVNSINF